MSRRRARGASRRGGSSYPFVPAGDPRVHLLGEVGAPGLRSALSLLRRREGFLEGALRRLPLAAFPLPLAEFCADAIEVRRRDVRARLRGDEPRLEVAAARLGGFERREGTGGGGARVLGGGV